MEGAAPVDGCRKGLEEALPAPLVDALGLGLLLRLVQVLTGWSDVKAGAASERFC